jgi:hypothetical protein
MSAEATPVLQRLGYTNIIDLKGGMNAWRDAGLPLLNRNLSGSSSGIPLESMVHDLRLRAIPTDCPAAGRGGVQCWGGRCSEGALCADWQRSR